MIDKMNAFAFCKEDISLIENYEKAINDKENCWVCHHKDEVRFLPSGMTVIRSAEELEENNRYFNCPANELVFLPKSYHTAFHNKYMNKERKEKQIEHCKKIGSLGAGIKKERHSIWFKEYGLYKNQIMNKLNFGRHKVECLHKNKKLKEVLNGSK